MTPLSPARKLALILFVGLVSMIALYDCGHSSGYGEGWSDGYERGRKH